MPQGLIVLGGKNIICEMDGTVLSRRGIIRSPTSFDENRSYTAWILGAIDNTDQRNFFLKRNEIRTTVAITLVSHGKIAADPYLYTDRFASYPQVAKNLNLIHKVVNQCNGFVNDDIAFSV